MESPRLTVTLIAAGLAVLASAACKNKHNMTGISGGTPTGGFSGTFAGGNVSGVLSFTFPATASARGTHRDAFRIVPAAHAAVVAAQASAISGSLAVSGDGTYTLMGSYDASASPELSVTGGGYTITGNFNAANGQLSGSFAGPGGVNGQWTVSGGTVKVFCGTYMETGGSSTQPWNLTLDTSNRLFGVVVTLSGGADQLAGSYTPGNNPNAVVTFHHGSASGNLNPTTGAGSGTWSDNTGHSGTWTANTTGC
jgi:hypothetical protein